jgi:hypothetical protein
MHLPLCNCPVHALFDVLEAFANPCNSFSTVSFFQLFSTAFRCCYCFYSSGLNLINVPFRLAVNSSVLPARTTILATLVMHTVSLTQQLPCSDPAGREPREVPASQQGGQVLHECQPCGYLGEPLHNTGLAELQCLSVCLVGHNYRRVRTQSLNDGRKEAFGQGKGAPQ